jgi:nucleotide-binding universal stress UspA family protein
MANLNRRKYRRIVVHIDASSSYRRVFRSAAEIAARLGAELHGVFIEDRNLLNIGGLDFVREFSRFMPTAQILDSVRIEQQLKALARSAQNQLEHEATGRNLAAGFHTVREEFGSEAASIVSDADLIIIERTSQSHLLSAIFLSQPDKTEQPAHLPILLLKGNDGLHAPFIVLCDSQATAEDCLNFGASLAQKEDQEIIVLPCTASDPNTAPLVDKLKDTMQEVSATFHLAPPVKPEAEAIFRRLSASNNLLILARNGTLANDKILLQKLIESRHPILFV